MEKESAPEERLFSLHPCLRGQSVPSSPSSRVTHHSSTHASLEANHKPGTTNEQRANVIPALARARPNGWPRAAADHMRNSVPQAGPPSAHNLVECRNDSTLDARCRIRTREFDTRFVTDRFSFRLAQGGRAHSWPSGMKPIARVLNNATRRADAE